MTSIELEDVLCPRLARPRFVRKALRSTISLRPRPVCERHKDTTEKRPSEYDRNGWFSVESFR